MRYRTYALMVVTCITLISIIGYLGVTARHNASALRRIQTAQETAKLSGQYQFRTEIDQISGYAPQITNYARPSRHDQIVIDGAINESLQTSTLTIANANGIMLEIKREQGLTYARQPGTGWQRTNSSNAAQINTLSYLAGISHATVNPQTTNSYDFDFDGLAFTEHFARLLSADAAHGITYNKEWYAIADLSQFKKSMGNGQITLDNDGLPSTMAIQLTTPASDRTGSVQTNIKTTFFAYARTGLALQKLVNNPLSLIGNMLGTDSNAIRNLLFGLLALVAVSTIGGLTYLFRTRLYLPITMLALGMMVFQPYSNIPTSRAANTVNTPGPQDPNTPPSDAVTQASQPQFNPLIAPLNQVASIALPSAGTSTSSGTVMGNASTSRSLSTSRAVAGALDSDKDKLSDSDEALIGTNPNKADSDNDGLSDYDEVQLGTNPLVADADNDKLNDFAEVQLGTNPNKADTDLDLLSDFVEVTEYTQYPGSANRFYTNPRVADSNGDGINDGVECSAKLDNPKSNCNDTNNDRVPDFLSFDNDGDNVGDEYDLTPNTSRATVYTDAAPYAYKILNTATTVKPLLVDFQIRPSNEALLYVNNAVYDWPAGDTEGQFQRGKDTTFANSSLFNSTDATASNGDIRLTAMLEVRIPISSGNYGNLPTAACPSTLNDTIQLNSSDRNSCVDTSKTKPFALNVGWSRDSQGAVKNNEVTVSVPLTTNYDASGSIVAYTGTMYYATGPQAWLNNHQMRMQWVVAAISDACPASKPDCSTSERVDAVTVLQNYYADWKLTGMNATESSGVKAAVIAEDSSKAVVTTAEKRRLNISLLSDLLNASFVTYPFLSIDKASTDKTKSIPLLFDSTQNSGNLETAKYGVDGQATLVKTFTYATSYDVVKLSGTEIPTILNGLVSKSGNCENNTTVVCRPAVIVLTESNERKIAMGSGNDIDFAGSDSTIIRAKTGMLFKIKSGKWQQAESDDLANEFVEIQKGQAVAANPSPTSMTETEWKALQQQLILTSITSFVNPESNAYLVRSMATLMAKITQSSFQSSNPSSWAAANTGIYNQYKKVFDNLFEKLHQTGVAAATKDSNDKNIATSSFLLLTIAADVLGNFDDIATSPKVVGASAALIAAGVVLLIAGAISAATGVDPAITKAINIAGQATLAVAATYALVKTAISTAAVLKAAGGSLTAASTAASAAAGAVSTAAKAAKGLAIAGAVIGIAIAVVFGIMTAVNAEYGWQKANAISSMIGTSLAIAFVLAISFIPVIGQLIAAVIAVLDVIAAVACATLSEKEQRSTAGKWLCGGVTGLLANIFTPYASNIVVDPDDPWSHYMNVTASDDTRISTPSTGFRVGNNITTGLNVTDYIERMPFPSTWMALPWFWQWNNQDTRAASFNYAFGPTQTDMAYSIARGSQLGSWQANSWCDITETECLYYSDGEKTYQYRKTVKVETASPFIQSGINVAMPALWLSTTFKVPQQTCINLFIFFIPIPICWIETHTANPKYININEDSTTKYDIFPSTIDEFITMRAKDDGYTFNWSSDTATPSFPKFKDADNDGLSNDLEIKYRSRDNTSDTDGDGVTDNREVANGTLANAIDSDKDGLTDSQEILYGTNPIMPDSDGDGLLDSEEVVHMDSTGKVVGGWDVTYAIINGVAQVTWTDSNPNSADGDNDGIIDLREKVLGWSPYAKNSGDILSVAGSARESLQALFQVGFESKSATGFSSSGIAVSNVACVGICPTVDTTARISNPSLVFNGSQSLNAGAGLQSNFDRQFTVAAWIKPSGNTTQTIFNQAGQLGVFRTATGTIRVWIATRAGIFDYVSAGITPVNSWSHVAVTFSDKVLVVYIDGVERSRSDVPNRLSDLDSSNNNFTIAPAVVITEAKRYCYGKGQGCRTTPLESANAYTGGLDDVAVFQVGLRAQEIQQLKDGLLPNGNDLIVRPGDRIITSVNATNKLLGRSMQGYTTVSGVSSANGFQSDQITETSLAAAASTSFDGVIELPGQINYATTPSSYANSCVFGANELCLKFDETTGTIPMKFNDLSGNNRMVTNAQIICASTVACPVLNSADGSWKFATTTNLQTSAIVGNNIGNHDFSIAAWVRPEGQSAALRTVINSTNTNAVLQVALNLERPQFTVGNNVLLADNALPLGQWSHVAFVMAAQTRQIYVNGVLVKRDNTPIAYLGSYGALQIGKDAGINSLAGSLRDLQVNSRALTQRQITSLANTCEDPSLIACIPRTGSNLTDYSSFGINQAVALQTGPSGFSYKLPTGYASLLTEQNFSIVGKVTLTNSTQTILQTGTAIGTGNSLKLWVNAGIATLTIGSKTVTTAGSLSTGVPYVIAARYKSGVLSLSVHRASDQTIQSASNQISSPALLQGQDPLSIQQNTGIQVSKLRIYRIAVSDTTIAAIARHTLLGTIEVALNQAPVSDQLRVNVDARTKVIVPDPNFERSPLPTGNCNAASSVICLPFTATESRFNPTLADATASQSSLYLAVFPAANAIDGNTGSFNHTNNESTSPWLQIDLGSSKDINSVTITNRVDCCSVRLRGAVLFLSDTPLMTTQTTIASTKPLAKDWRNIACNDKSASCTTDGTVMTVTFPVGTKARYLLIRNPAPGEPGHNGGYNGLHVAEVSATSNLNPCTTSNTCPAIDGGATFTAGKRLSLSNVASKATFDKQHAFTVMAWVRLNAVGGDQIILADKLGHKAPVKLLVQNGRVVLDYPNSKITSVQTLVANRWYHLAFSYGGMYPGIYINGVRDKELPSMPFPVTADEPREMSIGANSDGTSSLNGSMSNLQVHNVPLNATEINNDAATSPASELRFALNEPTGSNSFGDIQNTTMTLTCVSDCPLSGMPGRDDRAVHFDGNQPLRLSNASQNYISFVASRDYTISMWVRPSKYNTWLIGGDANNQLARVGITVDGKLSFERMLRLCAWGCAYYSPTTPLISNGVLPLNMWSHVLVSVVNDTEYVSINGTINSRGQPAYTYYTYNNQINESNALTIGEEFTGGIDEVFISALGTTTTNDVVAQMNRSPNWNLTFEDTISMNRTSVTDGVTNTAQIDAVALPNDVPGRAGIQRFEYAASCNSPEIVSAECPVGNTVGMAGIANLFNGRTTMLQVANGTTLMDEIKAGGSVQMMVKPDVTTGTQTLLHYGNNTTNAFQVQLVNGKIQVSFGARTFTASSALPSAWNQISFSFGPGGIKYFQNGTPDTTIVESWTGAVTEFTTNSAHKLRIGGKLSGTTFSEMFKGGIDDITFTPSAVQDAKIFQIARSQFSQAVTKATVASVLIDADVPTVSITNPPYVARLPNQFLINTKDPSSYVTRVSANITSTLSATGSILSSPRTIAINAPACIDAVNGSAYCPTFAVGTNATIPVEGKYGLQANAYDAVANMGASSALILVDTTPPTAALLRPSGVYTITRAIDQTIPKITLSLSASDPVLTNSGNSLGSGVAQLSVNIKDASGRTINRMPVPAILRNGQWMAQVSLPFSNPSGFYQIGAIVTDNVGNTSSEIMIANASNMIEVDGSAPNDTINYPSPYSTDQYFVSNQAISGRISDYGDGRSPIQQGLRVRLDFEAPDGAQAFDNRADNRYNTSCTQCPVIAVDSVDTSRRVARFNIDALGQSLTIANAATVLTGTFSIAFMAKISDVGTILSTGIASNPRLRIKVDKAGTTFKVTAQRGTTSVVTPATLTANTWYHFIYSEYRNGTVPTLSLAYGTNLAAMQNTPATSTFTKAVGTAPMPPVQSDIVLGAMQSSALSTAKEDFFKGSIDDVIVTPFPLTPLDLIGKPVSQGSGVATHFTRLAIDDDGFTNTDGLAALADFYMPMNQADLPVVDAINGIRSTRCVADKTITPQTCPTIGAGFARNAVQLNRISDGLATDYALQTSASTARSIALRVRINTAAQSGVIAWAQAVSSTNSLALQVIYQQETKRLAVTINDQTTILLTAAESGVAINDNNWHSLVVTSQGNSTNEQVKVYFDGNLAVTKTIAGHWNNAMLGVGALTGVSVYNGVASSTTAAVNTQIDDLAVFRTALTSANVNDYSFGYGTVYHETFDDANAGINAITVDNSPYQLPSIVTSADNKLTRVIGTVGSAAIAFDGNDQIVHRDDNLLTFAEYNQPWSVSAWVTPKTSGSTATIIKGVFNGYTYELSLSSGKPRFVMAGIVLQASNQVATSSASHVVVSSTGRYATLVVNGTSVASVSTSVGTPILNRTAVTIPFANKLQSAANGNGANNAYDGNLDTYAEVPSMANPYWAATNNANTPIDQITIYSRVANKPLFNFIVEIRNTAGVVQWSASIAGPVTDKITIPVPNGISGAQVWIRATGVRTLAISEVQITASPIIKIGTGFSGIIDDVRVYRRALSNNDITKLQAMAWQQSVLTQRIDGYSWQRPQVSNIEVDASIQSMALDNNGNSQVTIGETPLWNGNIDTQAPRVVASNTNGNYTVSVTDRNLDTTKINTPCGAKLTLQQQKPNSLWFLQQMSVLDGTYNVPTNVTGTCVLSDSPEMIRSNSQVISATTTLAYGLRYAYIGGDNQLSTVDVRSGRSMLLRSTIVPGTITQLMVNESRNKLYVISTANALTTLQVFDIFTTPTNPILLGTLPIELPLGTTISKLGITSGAGNADTFAVLGDSSTPQNLISINVSNPRNLTRASVTVGAPQPGYDMTAKNDIVVTANGDVGVVIYRIDSSGGLDAIVQYAPAGYSHRVNIFGNQLYVITDDEPYDGVTAPASANSLRTIPLIASVQSGIATLYTPISERNTYMHTSPQSDDNVSWYRINDVVQYGTNELLLLSNDSGSENNLRISLIDVAGSQALLEAETQIIQTTPVRIASNSQSMIVLAKQNNQTTAIGYQISDARLATSACDLRNNCSDVPSAISTVPTLNQLLPTQPSIQLIDQANYYSTASQLLQVRAEAPAGINNITLFANNTQVARFDTGGTPQLVETTFALNLPSGTYTITARLTDSNAITTSSTVLDTVVDLTAPQINLLDPVIGVSQLVNELFMIRIVISDDVGLDNLQIINKLTNAYIPFTRKDQGNSTLITATYNRRASDARGVPIRIIANDITGRNTTLDHTVTFDTAAPIASDVAVNASLNGSVVALAPEQLVSNSSTADLNVAWSKISDVSNIVLNQLEYTVKTLSGSTAYTMTLPSSGFTLPAGKFSPLTTAEASRITFGQRLRDILGNEALTPLSSLYVDAPTTPDYTMMNDGEPTYRGFVGNGCAALGEDRRPTNVGIQRFATTWDAQALRFNWQGADWNTDGDLFVYLDTIAGGTVKAYRPGNYTQSITDSVTFGESYITLPVNMAARTGGRSSSLASYVNEFQSNLRQSQQGIRTSGVQGADYVIHIENRTTATILRWNGNDWLNEGIVPDYRYADELGIKQTDIRARFSQIGYVAGQPLGVIAFATAPAMFLPWSTFPGANPVRTEQTGKITITPMLNGYGWSNATAGVCPNSTVLNPDTTRVIAALTSTPNGVSNRAMADNFANTEPDAISEIISETRELCSRLINNGWCTTVNQYDTVSNTGSAFLDTLAGALATEQYPLVGNNSLVSYVLTVQNPTNKPTRTMYGIVQTYGGIWLTDGNSIGTPPVAIIGGGIYDYHSVSSAVRDYHLIKFNPIPANSTVSFTLNAKIDVNKAQASAIDRNNTATVAKLEVRLTDDGTTTNINQARTIEWLNAAVAIDSSAPSQIVADNQAIVKPGSMAYTGNVSDDSDVTAVYLQYATNNATTTQQINCGSAIAGRWSCPLTIGNSVTTIKYRLRASDKYNQQGPWSAWYGSVIDTTPPQFAFSDQTNTMLTASYVGGSIINLTGVVSDTASEASIKVCDEKTAVCDYGSTVNPTINQSVISDTLVANIVVDAMPCDSTDFGSYTALPINITTAALQQRVSSVVVAAQVASQAAQELNLWLQSPSGTFTPLLTSQRPSTVNIYPRFTDSAIADTTTLTSTVLGGSATDVKPDGNLALFRGEPINGTWLLLACDRDQNNSRSTINSWALTLTSAGTSVSTNAPWSYTVKNTAEQDNVVRILEIWSIDSTNNASNWRTIALNIDTVAPSITIDQRVTSLLPDSQSTVFQGTASDGGALSRVSANIYDATKLVSSVNVALQQTSSQESARWNYLLSRSITAYTWQLAIDASTLGTGEYQVQFVTTDAAGNQRISDAYPLSIMTTTPPAISNVSLPTTRRNDTALLQSNVSTGNGPTSIQTTISLDSDVTAPITSTTLMVWNSSGIADIVAQNQITSTLQATLFSQLEMNNHLAAALDGNGTLTTWALKNTNTIALTAPISNVMQIALGDSSNQHLLTLSSSGVITDYQPGGIARTVTVPISDTAVAIAAGTTHNLAILQSGKLYGWGSNTNGETTIPSNATMGISQIAAGNGFSLALKSDGRVIGWGANNLNQTTIPISATVGVSQIATGDSHAIALRSDGVVLAWGDNSVGQTTVPISATNVIYVAANANSSAAITRDGLVLVWGATQSARSCCPGTSSIALNSSQIMTNQMNTSQTQIITRPASLTPITVQNRFNGLLPGRRYRYTIEVTNEKGSARYTGIFDTNLRYNQQFLPFLNSLNADGVEPVNTTSGK